MGKIYYIDDYRPKEQPNTELLRAFKLAVEAYNFNLGGAGSGRAALRNVNANPSTRPGDKGKERTP